MTSRQQDMFQNPLARARELKSKRRYDEAMEVLHQVLARDPDDLKARASLADLHYRTGRYRDAMTLAGQILRDDPDDPRALVVMGNVLHARKKPREALEYFRLALRVAETDYLWARVARCHLDAGEPGAALDAANRGEAIRPDATELLRLKAEAARALKNVVLERDVFRHAARMAPADEEGFANFVAPLLQDLPPRRAALQSESLRETPGQELNPFLLVLESGAHLQARDPRSALARLKSLLALDIPDDLRNEAEKMRAIAESTVDAAPRHP